MTFISFIRRHRVACFFVLAYFLTWGTIPWNSFNTPGALIAAVVVVLVTEGPRGLLHLGSRLIRWRVSWVWYALAIGVPLFVHFASTSVNVALGASAPSLSVLTPWYGLPMAVGMHIISPFGGPMMEEPSFRGFAQPELQKGRSPLAATAIMAVLVTGWHMPLFFMPVFEAHPIGIVTTLAVTFWYAWLFNHASGSSLLTLIAHGTEGGVETNSLWGPGGDLERLNFVYAAAWCLVALTLLVVHRRFWTTTAPAHGSADARPSSRAPADIGTGTGQR
jgi:membrane protease YdiL (CAAX protease family)